MFALAEILGKTVCELQEITISEWNHWLSYFEIKREKEKKYRR